MFQPRNDEYLLDGFELVKGAGKLQIVGKQYPNEFITFEEWLIKFFSNPLSERPLNLLCYRRFAIPKDINHNSLKTLECSCYDLNAWKSHIASEDSSAALFTSAGRESLTDPYDIALLVTLKDDPTEKLVVFIDLKSHYDKTTGDIFRPHFDYSNTRRYSQYFHMLNVTQSITEEDLQMAICEHFVRDAGCMLTPLLFKVALFTFRALHLIR